MGRDSNFQAQAWQHEEIHDRQRNLSNATLLMCKLSKAEELLRKTETLTETYEAEIEEMDGQLDLIHQGKAVINKNMEKLFDFLMNIEHRMEKMDEFVDTQIAVQSDHYMNITNSLQKKVESIIENRSTIQERYAQGLAQRRGQLEQKKAELEELKSLEGENLKEAYNVEIEIQNESEKLQALTETDKITEDLKTRSARIEESKEDQMAEADATTKELEESRVKKEFLEQTINDKKKFLEEMKAKLESTADEAMAKETRLADFLPLNDLLNQVNNVTQLEADQFWQQEVMSLRTYQTEKQKYDKIISDNEEIHLETEQKIAHWNDSKDEKDSFVNQSDFVDSEFALATTKLEDAEQELIKMKNSMNTRYDEVRKAQTILEQEMQQLKAEKSKLVTEAESVETLMNNNALKFTKKYNDMKQKRREAQVRLQEERNQQSRFLQLGLLPNLEVPKDETRRSATFDVGSSSQASSESSQQSQVKSQALPKYSQKSEKKLELPVFLEEQSEDKKEEPPKQSVDEQSDAGDEEHAAGAEPDTSFDISFTTDIDESMF